MELIFKKLKVDMKKLGLETVHHVIIYMQIICIKLFPDYHGIKVRNFFGKNIDKKALVT